MREARFKEVQLLRAGTRGECKTCRELAKGTYFDDGKLMFAGKVHQGLKPTNRKALLKSLHPLRVEKCPFANLPTSKSGHWAKA